MGYAQPMGFPLFKGNGWANIQEFPFRAFSSSTLLYCPFLILCVYGSKQKLQSIGGCHYLYSREGMLETLDLDLCFGPRNLHYSPTHRKTCTEIAVNCNLCTQSVPSSRLQGCNFGRLVQVSSLSFDFTSLYRNFQTDTKSV